MRRKKHVILRSVATKDPADTTRSFTSLRMTAERKGSGPRDATRLFHRAMVVFVFLLIGKVGWGMPWSTDLYDQPSVKPQERQIQVPQDSIPVNGKTERIPRDIADKTLKNPIPATPESIEMGRHRFEITCSPCHGLSGKGEGPVSKKFIPPPDLTGDFVQARSDGYIFGTIANGGAIMPSYRVQLSPEQRWHVINYIRSLKQ